MLSAKSLELMLPPPQKIIRKIHDTVDWSVSDPLAVHHQLPGAGFPPDWLCCHHSGKTCP